MGTDELKQVEKDQFDSQSVVEKLKSLIKDGASKEEIVAMLKSATKYLEDPKDVEDFEDYLSSKIYTKVAELPGIKEGLVGVMTNPTFNQAKNEYDRHTRAGRLGQAQAFLEKMIDTAQTDQEKSEALKIEELFRKSDPDVMYSTATFNKAENEYHRHNRAGRAEKCKQAFKFMETYAETDREKEIVLNIKGLYDR